ncbi:MAG: MMPL family transporter [Gracilimonas sp.]|uniref:efflux RND transporter permease subunit n=1 Tax=Gracilimonas sp. TaxID=1974203 RepID=UPI00375331F7|nr:MMPL family transporter [Gracilimonas sp.]
MLKLADFIIKFRWWIIAGTLLITAILGWKTVQTLSLNADFSSYLSEDDPLVQEYNRIGEVYGSNSTGMVLVSSERVFDPQTLQLIKKLTEAYSDVEGIRYVTSLTNVLDFRKTDWGLEVGKLLNQGEIPQDPKTLAGLENYVMDKERFEGNLVSGDKTTTGIILRFDSDTGEFATSLRVGEASDRVLGELSASPSAQIYYGGMPFLIYNMTLLIGENMSILIPLMLLLLITILYLGLRHWSGVVFPLTVVAVSTIWTTGLMGFWDLQFDLLTGIMPVVLIALGSADGIHLMKRFYERRRQGESARGAAHFTFRDMGTPIMLTTITTAVGFASLSISEFSVIRQFGLLTALGVVLALVVTLMLLPALLSFGVGYKITQADTAQPSKISGTRRLAGWLFNHRWTIISLTGAVVVVSLIAIPRIQKDVDWTLCLAKGSDAYHAEMLLRNKFGGSLPLQLVVRGDLKDPAILSAMRTVERKLQTVAEVSKPQSMASIIGEMNEAMNDRFVIPQTRQGVTNLWFLVEDEQEMEQMVGPEENESLMNFKLGTWHTATLAASVDSVDAYLKSLPSKMAVVNPRLVSGPARERLDQMRQARLSRELDWLLERYDIRTTDAQRSTMATAAIRFSINDEVRRALTGYLQNPQAELELSSERIQATASLIAGQLRSAYAPGIGPITEQILQANPGMNPDDAEWLGGSLTAVAQESLNEARVGTAMSRLEPLLDETGNRDQLRKYARGLFWKTGDDRVLVDAARAPELLGENTAAIDREVEWNIYQAGMPSVLKSMEENLTPTQVQSLLMALIFVVILLGVIFRSSLIALIGVAPITLTILINFAVMGYLGIGLDSFTAMIASIIIGLGIDTDIHFISRFRDEFNASGDKLEALKTTLSTTGLAIITNALAVGSGFLVLLFAGGQHIRRFGGLTSLTMFVSATFSLTLLAILLLWLKPKYLQRNMVKQEQLKREMTKKI